MVIEQTSRGERSFDIYSRLRYQVGRWGQSTMMKGELAQAEILTLEPETLRSLMK